MMRRGLTAAGLLVATFVLVAGGRVESAKTTTIAHTCGALDRQFIRAAALGDTTIALLNQEYAAGDVTPPQMIAATRNVARGIEITDPHDGSLRMVRSLMGGMFSEYGQAIHARWKGGDDRAHLYRSYTYANYANQVLTDVQPVLQPQGCAVSDLLQQ
jgi:hypothetical protein